MPRLLLDEMLKKLAKWLRVFGISAEHIEKWSDSEILLYAKRKRRLLLTRDAPLAKRCEKKKVRCLLLHTQTIPGQLREIQSALKIQLPFPKKTRCPECNTLLKIVSPRAVRALVHPGVFQKHKKFWLCKTCNKAYWEGGHWKNIRRIYAETKK